MNTKYYFVYGKKSGNQLTKAVRYRKLAVKTCAKMNGIILPGTKTKRPVEAMPMPLFPDYQEQPAAADPDKRKRQYAVGYMRITDVASFAVYPAKVVLDPELIQDGHGWLLDNTVNHRSTETQGK